MLHRLVLAALSFALLLSAPASAAKLMGGDLPPDFVGVDERGGQVLLSASRGKVVAVVFWASWCGRCREELPLLERLQQGVGRGQLDVIAVNWKESARDLRRLRRSLGYTMTITHDPDGAVGEAFGVRSVPHLFLIDRSGRIAFVNVGFNAERTTPKLIEQFDELLAEDAPEA